MGFSDFQLNNNGKKETLQNAKNGIRKEQVDKKFHNLFDAYDVNGDGTLESNELNEVFKGLNSFAGVDKTLDSTENKKVASVFAEKMNIQNADFMGFVKSISNASADIVSSKEIPTADGGKEVVTTYKDGTTETISYYSDGDYKFKKVYKRTVSTSYDYTVGNNLDKKFTAQQIEDAIKKAYIRENHISTMSNGEILTKVKTSYKDFKKVYMSQYNVQKNKNTSTSEYTNLDLSERGKQDVAVKEFVLNHFVETHKSTQDALDTMGILDDIGAAINAGTGELWNSCKNLYNRHFGDGTEEDYKNFYELVKSFEPSYEKSLQMKGAQEFAQQHPENYFRGDVGNIDPNKGAKFQQTTEQYQNAQIMKQRIDILNKAMQEVNMYRSEQDALTYAPAQNEGLNPASHIVNANKLLLEYFGGDQEAVNMLLNGTIKNAEATIKAINDVKQETEKLNQSVLDGKTFENIRTDYQNQYKEIYGTDFVPDDLSEKVLDAKATGSMVKLAAITAISILITKSPIMTEMMGAAAGSAEATGAAANLMRTLVNKYGQTAVQQGIKFAMSSGTLATDVGLTLLNQTTSERGVNGEELLENAKSSAKFIYFGAYIGGPLAQAVSKQLGKVGATARMFDGGIKAGNGALQTTSITGDKLVQNLMKGGNKVLTKGGAFLTDVAAFTGLEVATEGQDIATAGKEQLEFLPKLKIMNGIIEYMLGGKVHATMSKVKMDAAIKQSGVKNWEIKEIKSPTKSMYEVKISKDMPPVRFTNSEELTTAMLEAIAGKYEKLNEVAESNSKTAIKDEKSSTKPSNDVKKSYVKPKLKETSFELSDDIMTSDKSNIKSQFETKFAEFVKDGSVEKMVTAFKEKYPNVDINELYSLPIFKYLDGNNKNTKYALDNIVKNYEDLKSFPYAKYDKYLSKLGGMQLSHLKFNDGITPEIFEKYNDFLTEDNFAQVLNGLTKDNVAILDKYIKEGRIDSQNIAYIKKFNNDLDRIIEKHVDKNDVTGFNNIISVIKNKHIEVLNKFEDFIDSSNLQTIINISEVKLPRVKNIPPELLGTIITKDNFLTLISKRVDLTQPIDEYGKNFDKVNWDEYRDYVGKISLTPQIIDLMAKGIDKETLNYMCKVWPTASHAGEQLPFDTYFNNPELLDNRPYMIKLELYEQCYQPDMIKHAEGNPTVLKMFNNLKTRLEKELKTPVDVIPVDKQTKNNFLKSISNNSENDALIRQAKDNPEIKNNLETSILTMFPELKTLSKENNYADKLIKVVNSPEYNSLSDNSKFTLKLACIMSDVEQNSAYSLLEKLNLTYKVKRTVMELLDSENLLNFDMAHINEQYVATIMNTPEKVAMLDLFTEAKTGNKLDEQKKKLISIFQNRINQTGIPLFPTVLPQGKNMDKIPTVEYNNTTYQVLDLTKETGDLSQYGFVPGTTVKNFTVDVTFVRNLGEAETIRLTSNPNYSGVPCSSKIGLGQNGTFEGRQFGIPFSVTDKNDYVQAYYKDADIGHGAKNELLATDKIFDSHWNQLEPADLIKRNLLAEEVREKLGFTKEQYAQLYSQIIDKKYYTQIKTLKIDGQELSKDELNNVIQVLQEAQYKLVNTEYFKGTHNETNIRKPEVNKNFIIAKVNDISEVPQEWLDYAKKHDLKFIFVGDSQVNKTKSTPIQEFNTYLDELAKNGRDYQPVFEDPNSPFAKYYATLLDNFQKQVKNYDDAISQGRKPFGGKPKYVSKPNLQNFQSFLLRNSNNLNLSKEEYWQVVKEVNQNIVNEIKTNPLNFRKEIVENAEKIQEWASIFATQNPKTGNSKFYDENKFNQAIKEYTQFVEQLTGKKVLIGCPSRMNWGVSILGMLNNPESYAGVDYILISHGKGSSLIQDTQNPNTWRFSDNDNSVYEFIEKNVPKGKKVLAFTCEVEGLKLAGKTREEMIDRAGNRMLGIGSPVSGEYEESGAAKIVESGIRHIIGQISSERITFSDLGNTPVLDNNAGHINIANQVKKLYYDLDFSKFENIQ